MLQNKSDIAKGPLTKEGLFFFDDSLKNNFSKKYLIGVDEVGRGPLAGPVVAGACVIFNYEPWMSEINDSKKLTASKRNDIFRKMITSKSLKLSFSYCDNNEIDNLNILNASLCAMKKAVIRLLNYLNEDPKNFLIAVDGNKKIKDISLEQLSIVKGDSKSLAIAAASIFAKVIRDRWMDIIHLSAPVYDFKKHKGYPTKYHTDMIKKYGLSPYHRKSFSPCKI